MRLLAIINKAEREADVLFHIFRELSLLSPGFTGTTVEYSDPHIMSKAFAFEPTIILTFPMTSKGLALRHYALKLAFGCHIVTLQSEGIVNFKDDTCYHYYAGLDEYGPDLIDMQMMWSGALVDTVGQILLDSGKIASPDRIVSVGFPKLEGYLGGVDICRETTPATKDFVARVSGYPREKVFFWATGFSLGEYTVADLVRASDIFDGEESIQAQKDDAQRAIDASKAFRDRLIRTLDEISPCTPDALHVIKSHPVENIFYKRKNLNPYHSLLHHKNILYYDEPMYIKTILENSGILFHVGSTVLSEAYLAKTPGVFIASEDLFSSDKMSPNPNFNMHDMGWPSQYSCDITHLQELVLNHYQRPLEFFFTPEMMDRLQKGFDVRPEHLAGTQPYQSLRRIATHMIRVHEQPPLQCRLETPGVSQILKQHYLPAIMNYFFSATQRKDMDDAQKMAYLQRMKLVRNLLAN